MVNISIERKWLNICEVPTIIYLSINKWKLTHFRKYFLHFQHFNKYDSLLFRLIIIGFFTFCESEIWKFLIKYQIWNFNPLLLSQLKAFALQQPKTDSIAVSLENKGSQSNKPHGNLKTSFLRESCPQLQPFRELSQNWRREEQFKT